MVTGACFRIHVENVIVWSHSLFHSIVVCAFNRTLFQRHVT